LKFCKLAEDFAIGVDFKTERKGRQDLEIRSVSGTQRNVYEVIL